MATIVLNGEQVRVNQGTDGNLYSKNFRSMKQECYNAGTVDFRLNRDRHAFFLGSKAYYVGKSLQGKSVAEIVAVGNDIQICDSLTEKNYNAQVAANEARIAAGEQPQPIEWVPCLFVASVGEAGSFKFEG